MQQIWRLDQHQPPLPGDWTPYNFLVIELKSSSPQYFDLALHTSQGERSLRFHPFQGVWMRSAVPLYHFREPMNDGFDLASLGNKPRLTYFVNFHKNQGPLNQVEAISIRIAQPIGHPTIEVRSISLAIEDPGDAVLSDTPLVDEFGQWIGEDWPGKAHTLEDLQARWREEERASLEKPFPCSKYGGFLEFRSTPSGFFRVEQMDGRWWLIDPDGYPFISAGADCINPGGGTRITGREEIFRSLPPVSEHHEASGSEVSFPSWNLSRRYGDDFLAPWMDATFRRMQGWGLNTVANWSDPRLGETQRMPYVVTLRGWGIETAFLGLPDIYTQGYAEQVDLAAQRQCEAHKQDPWLLGYFIANEPAWPEREVLLTDTILAGPSTPIQLELKTYLAGEDTPQRRTAFVHTTFEKFLSIVTAAIRRHDPNHLNLGIRFGGTAPEAVIRMARIFDVYSHNIYAYVPDRAYLDHLYELTGRPMLIGEFHFGTPGRGMDSGLGPTLNYQERGVAYRYYVENAIAHPAMVGTHWFQWWDQPNTGRMDGENYNIGLVDITDQPYPDMVAAMRATHASLFKVHAAKQAPFSQLPAGRGEVIQYD